MTAESGTFKGTVQASKYLDTSGNNMMSGGKFKEEYLILDKLTLNFQKTITDNINKVTTDYTAAIKASATSLTTEYNQKITDINGKVTSVSSVATQAADKISWLVKSGSSSSNFTITDRMISLVSSQIYIDADQVNMRGAITWNDLSRSVQNDIDAALDAADIAQQIADGTYRGGTFISGTTIYSPTIYGDVFVGNSFQLYNGYGSIDIGYGATDMGRTYGIKMSGGYGYFIATDAGARMQAGSTNIHCDGRNITATQELTISSDRRVKNSICYDMDKYENFFHALEPCVFRYNREDTGRLHIGYIAQDVKRAMDENGLELSDFAGYVSGVNMGLEGCDDELALGYSEFTALNTFMIQKLYRQVAELRKVVEIINKKGGNYG